VWCTEEYFAGSPASLTRSLSPNSVNNTNDLDIGNRLYHLVRNPLVYFRWLFTSGVSVCVSVDAFHVCFASGCLQARNSVIVTGDMLSWSRRARQPMQPSQCSSPILTACWQHAVPSQEHCHPSVLWRCWLGDRKAIRPVKVLSQQFQKVYFWWPACPVVTWPGAFLEKWVG